MYEIRIARRTLHNATQTAAINARRRNYACSVYAVLGAFSYLQGFCNKRSDDPGARSVIAIFHFTYAIVARATPINCTVALSFVCYDRHVTAGCRYPTCKEDDCTYYRTAALDERVLRARISARQDMITGALVILYRDVSSDRLNNDGFLRVGFAVRRYRDDLGDDGRIDVTALFNRGDYGVGFVMRDRLNVSVTLGRTGREVNGFCVVVRVLRLNNYRLRSYLMTLGTRM